MTFPHTRPQRLKDWGWWSDGFGWQGEDTVLILILAAFVLFIGACGIAALIG